MVLIEFHGVIVDGVGNDGASAGDLGRRTAATNGVRQEVGTEASALHRCIESESTDQQQRNLGWHAPPQFGIGESLPLFHGCRNGVIAHDARGLRASADDIGAGRQSFARQGALLQPDIECGMFAVGKTRNVVMSL